MTEVTKPAKDPWEKLLNYPEIVNDFFLFVEEREQIRERRGQGQPYPWTNDFILRNANFTNVNRIHDAGTVCLLETLKHFDPEHHVYIVMVYRFLGSNAKIYRELQQVPIEKWVEYMSVPGKTIFNMKAYQAPNLPKGEGSGRRFVLEQLPPIVEEVKKLLAAGPTTIKKLGDAICDVYERHGHKRYIFHTNEICKDLSYIFPQVGRDEVHVGPGCRTGLRAMKVTLQQLVDDPRNARKLDADCVEHAVCEFRKYLEYKQGKPVKHRRRAETTDESTVYIPGSGSCTSR